MYVSAYTFQNILHFQSPVPLPSPGHACLNHRTQQLPLRSPFCSANAVWFPDGHHTAWNLLVAEPETGCRK